MMCVVPNTINSIKTDIKIGVIYPEGSLRCFSVTVVEDVNM